jgi:hypothetical protein
MRNRKRMRMNRRETKKLTLQKVNYTHLLRYKVSNLTNANLWRMVPNLI